MFMDIMRQVKFSMRSALGSCDLFLLYSFHICVANGSLFCISSGLSSSETPAVSSFHVSKKVSRSMPLQAADSVGDRSSLLSRVLAEVNDWYADEVAEEAS